MNVREMHIEVQQSIQQVAANRSRKFYPDEIDWVLNKMQDRYIQSRLRPKVDASGKPTGGFELDQLQADSIRMLLVTNKVLTPYLSADGIRYKCFLPADYKYLISDFSLTTNLCGTAPVEENRTLFITYLRQERSAKATPPYYETMSVVMPDGTVAIPGALPYGNTYAGYQAKEDVSFIVPWILWKSGWYWERFDDLYKPSHYMQVLETNPAITGAVNVDGTNYMETGITTKAYKVHPGNGLQASNRLSPSESISVLQRTPYYKSSFYSPVSELAGNILWVYRDNSFTVNSCYISYIRKPQPISLSLNTDCEIAPDFHQTICDLAVEYLKGRVENDKGVALTKTDLAERVII